MELTTPRLILREFRQSDFDAIRAYDCDPNVLRYERDFIPNEQLIQSMLDRVIQDQNQVPRTHYRFAITIQPEDINRGRVSLTLISPSIREYEIGWTVHPQYWGQGIAVEAAQAVLRYAFYQLGAHRVFAICHADNQSSERVMQKLGMQLEGRTRETRLLFGTWHDEQIYGILEREFT